MKVIVLFLTITIPINSYAAPDMKKVKSFVDLYINYIKLDDIESLKELSVSKRMCQHISAKRIIKSVGNNKYTIEIKPFTKDSKDYKFAVMLSNGAPLFLGNPSHLVYINWDYYKKESYTKGHKCHSIDPASSKIVLAISDKEKIKEHSYCKEYIEKNVHPETNITKDQFNTIKKHLDSQNQFSSFKVKQYIMKKYGFKYIEAHKALKYVCDNL